MPTTSLLITTCNRSHLLRNSLKRLTERTLPDEVLIVDDGGDDGCEDVVCDFRGHLSITYVYTHNPGDSQCCHSRNVGIKTTKCDLIITSEPELKFETDVIAQMLDWHKREPTKVISAGTIHTEGEDLSRTETLKGWVAPFTALYDRQWLVDIGGWDEFGWPDPWGWDDVDLLTRLRIAGHGQVIANEIEVLHQWHLSRACDQTANEAYFRSKGFDDDLSQLVANQGREWGIAKT